MRTQEEIEKSKGEDVVLEKIVPSIKKGERKTKKKKYEGSTDTLQTSDRIQPQPAIKAQGLYAKKIDYQDETIVSQLKPGESVPDIPMNTIQSTVELLKQQAPQTTALEVGRKLTTEEIRIKKSFGIIKHTDESQARSEKEAQGRKKKKYKNKGKKKEGKEEESEEEKTVLKKSPNLHAKDSLIHVESSASFKDVNIDNSTTYHYIFYSEKDSSSLNTNSSEMQQVLALFPESLKACYEKQKYLTLPFSDIKLRLRKNYINLAIIHYEEQKEKEKDLQLSAETMKSNVLNVLTPYDKNHPETLNMILFPKSFDSTSTISGHYPTKDSVSEENIKNVKENTLERTILPKTNTDKFQDSRLTSYEELFVPKQPIQVKELFELHKINFLKKHKNPIKPPERLLIWGRAGIGKSTFCQYVAHRWSRGKLWPEFKALFWIPLRWLTTYTFDSKNEITAQDLAQFLRYVLKQQFLQQQLPTDEIPSAKILQAYLEYSQDKILFLLDGLDEVAGLLEETTSAAGQLLQTLLQQRFFILTSRPGYAVNSDIISRQHHLEILGFTNLDIPIYVKRLYPKLQAAATSEDAEQLIRFLQINLSLWGVAHIPINLALICSTLEPQQLKELKGKTTFTLTALYYEMVLKLSRCYVVEKCQIKRAEKWPDHEILAFCQPILDFLGKLAFAAFQQKEDTLIISKQVVEDLLQDPVHSEALKEHVELIKQKTNLTVDLQDECFVLNNILQMGFLKPLTESNLQQGYYFIHLTFQEYFVADYLAQQLQSFSWEQNAELELFIQKHKYDRRYEIVWWFMLGLLQKKLDASIAQRATNHFFQLLCQAPQDQIGLRHLLLLVRCLEECEWKLAETKRQALLDHIKVWLKAGLQYEEIHTPLIHYLRLCPTLLRELSLATLVTQQLALSLKKIERKSGQLRMVGSLAVLFAAVQDELFICLSDPIKEIQNGKLFFKENEEYIRVVALKILAFADQSEFLPEILGFVVKLLGDKDRDIRDAALEVLVNQKELSAEIVEQVVKLLAHENRGIRCAALEVLGEQKKLSSKILELVVGLLTNEYKGIRNKAFKVLADQKKLSARIQKQVMKLFADKDVRSQVLGVLAGQEDLSVEILKQVVQSLADKDKDIQFQASNVLVAQKELSTEILEQVVKLLADKSEYVRYYALGALNGQEELSAKTLEQVVKLLADQDDEVQFQASRVLAAQKKLSAEILEQLMELLANKDVRYWVLNALDNQKELSAKILKQVVKLLADQDDEVQIQASNVLVAQKELSAEILEQVVKLLKHESEYVRFYALSALRDQEKLSAEILEQLMELLADDEDGEVRSQALRVLACQKELSAETLEQVVELLSDEDGEVQSQALRVLAGREELPVETLEKVVRLLADEDKYVQYRVLRVLAYQEEVSAEILEQVMKLLPDKDINFRYWISEVLIQQMTSSSFLEYWKNVKKIPAALKKYASEIFDVETITLTYLCELYCARPESFLIPFIVKKSVVEECALYFEDNALCFFVNKELQKLPLAKQRQKEFSQAIRKELEHTYGLKVSVSEIFGEKSSIAKLLSLHLPFRSHRSSNQSSEERTQEFRI